MASGGHAGIAIGVFIPEIIGLVTSAPDIEGIQIGTQLAGGVEHEVEVTANAFAHEEDVACFLACVPFMPAMDLKAGKAFLLTGQGIIGKGFGGVQTTRRRLTMIGAG